MILLAGREINPITPILICGGTEEMEMQTASGHVSAGSNAVITLTAKEAAPEKKPEPAQEEPKKMGFSINFDLLQKLGKVLMTVIAVMPAAGLMLSVGKLVQMAGADISMILTIGSTMENIGWAIINNLHILFAAAIGGSWAKERAGGAFAAIISFILINCITGAAFGVTSAMLNEEGAVVMSLFGQEMLVENYFTSVLGAPALNMGVFVGIIAGFVGGVVYNKYYNFRKLPDALSFFSGKRFVPMSLKAGIGADIIHFVICCAAFLAVGYAVAYFMIGKFQFATPGRLGNYTDENEDEGSAPAGSAGAGGGHRPGGFPKAATERKRILRNF